MIKGEDRSIKNRVAFLFFTACMVGGVMISLYSFANGSPKTVINGVDSFGNICGEKRNRKYLNSKQSGMNRESEGFILDMNFADKDVVNHKETWYNRKHAVLCVKECPTNTTTCQKILEENNYDKLDNKTIEKDICNIASGIIPPQIHILNRCVTQVLLVMLKLDHLVDDETETLQFLDFKYYLTYLKSNAEEILMMALFSALLSFACIVLFCFVPAFLIAILVTVVLVLVLSIETYLCYEMLLRMEWIDDEYFPKAFIDCIDKLEADLQKATYVIEKELDKFGVNNETQVLSPQNISFIKDKVADTFRKEPVSDKLAEAFADNLVSSIYSNGSYFDTNDDVSYDFEPEFDFKTFRSTDYFILVFTISTLITLVLVGALLYLRNSIEIGITLFQEASKMTLQVPILLIFVVVKLVIKLCLVVFCAVVLFYMFTCYKHRVKRNGFVELILDDTYKLSPLFIIWCMLIWNFCNACHQFITGFVVGQYYFQDKSLPLKFLGYNRCAFFACFYLVRYHLGSVACSAMVMTVFYVVFILVWLINPSKNKYDRKRISISNPILNCVSCILFKIAVLLQWFLEFFNQNSIFLVGMFGYGYFEASKRVYALLAEDITLTAVVYVLQKAFIFIAQIAVFISVALVAGISYKMIASFTAGENVYFLIGLVLALIVIHEIFQSFAYNLQVYLICFAYDLRENNGDDRPYHSRKQLRKVMMRNVKRKSTRESKSHESKSRESKLRGSEHSRSHENTLPSYSRSSVGDR